MTLEANPTRMPTIFLPHGGGPCFFMDWPGDPHLWDSTAAFLRSILSTLPRKPTAIVIVSAHWEADRPTVTAGERPALVFDYSGFPKHTYELEYPVLGSPYVAENIRSLLAASGIDARADAGRGFDHGVFVPLLLVAPEGDIPVVQLSLVRDLDPRRHLEIGRALAPLRDEDVLVVGSGMSFHNMSALRGLGPTDADAFDAWLGEAVVAPDAERFERLVAWSRAPQARLAHPREEHLLPLMIVAGAAQGDAGSIVYRDRLGDGALISAYRFG